MAPTIEDPLLFPDQTEIPDGIVVINDRCRLQQSKGYRVVIVRGMPLSHFAAADIYHRLASSSVSERPRQAIRRQRFFVSEDVEEIR